MSEAEQNGPCLDFANNECSVMCGEYMVMMNRKRMEGDDAVLQLKRDVLATMESVIASRTQTTGTLRAMTRAIIKKFGGLSLDAVVYKISR